MATIARAPAMTAAFAYQGFIGSREYRISCAREASSQRPVTSTPQSRHRDRCADSSLLRCVEAEERDIVARLLDHSDSRSQGAADGEPREDVVLIVADDAELRVNFREVLKDGIRLEEAEDAEGAL